MRRVLANQNPEFTFHNCVSFLPIRIPWSSNYYSFLKPDSTQKLCLSAWSIPWVDSKKAYFGIQFHPEWSWYSYWCVQKALAAGLRVSYVLVSHCVQSAWEFSLQLDLQFMCSECKVYTRDSVLYLHTVSPCVQAVSCSTYTCTHSCAGSPERRSDKLEKHTPCKHNNCKV